MRRFVLIMLAGVLGCSKPKAPSPDTEIPLNGIIPEMQQARLRSLSPYAPKAEMTLDILLKEGDDVVRTIALRRAGKWPSLKSLPALERSFRKDLSPRVRKTALELIWEQTGSSETLVRARMEAGLIAIRDADDGIFELGFTLMAHALTSTYVSELKAAMIKAPKRRWARMFTLYCTMELAPEEMRFLVRWGNEKGHLPSNCVRKVMAFRHRSGRK